MDIRRRGGNPYEGYPVKQVVVKPNCGKWYAVLFHELPDELVATPDNGQAIGVDMNVGQVATSEGEIIPMRHLAKLEARKRRYQRRLDTRHVRGSNHYKATRRKLAKTCRRIRNARAMSTTRVPLSPLVARPAGNVSSTQHLREPMVANN